MAKQTKETPLMKQYNQIKAKYPDTLLLFRVGDFYETFGEDAVKASQVLGIVLTKRNNGSERSELAGFPHFSLNTYLPKLVKAGFRVAICDQLEDPKLTKSIVKRGVTELVTPGVALNDELLQAKSNNFLASIYTEKNQTGVAFLDVSTGEFLCSQGDKSYIEKLLESFAPSEVIAPKSQKKDFLSQYADTFHHFFLDDWIYSLSYAHESLIKHFQTSSLKGFGIDELPLGIIAAGGILHYLGETQHTKLAHISAIGRIVEDQHVWLDRFTIRNLELYGQKEQGVSLLEVIDQTASPMGSRTLRRWLSLPLKSVEKIRERQQIVQYFVQNTEVLAQFQEQLKLVGDLERLASKVATGKISPREVVQLQRSLQIIAPLKTLALQAQNPSVRRLGDRLHACTELTLQIGRTLQDDAPVNISKGNVIKEGFCSELDELRNLSINSQELLSQMLERESLATGIPSLKIDSNNIFGYYIEVRNTHKNKVPAQWIRKQTLVSAERYITEELKTYESKIMGAQERIAALEQQYFTQLIEQMMGYIPQIQLNANLLGGIDVLCGFASLANEQNYHCPEVNDGYVIDIKQGRHPVIEKQLPIEKPYIANDVYLDNTTQQIMMITGPNMSGKSAILRQTALIVLLAQIGSFVPAQEAQIGIVDKIFTRVGASDNISMGESTFMVEMNEAALILNNLSQRSLILLDEIGRGTATYDGISIAWAIAEYLHQHPTKAKTLFATHYHELNQMTDSFERIKNFNVAVKETQQEILFLRKLLRGGSEHSFGIQVAKMAGMPQYVVSKAYQVLQRLERQNSAKASNNTQAMQLNLFEINDPTLQKVRDELTHLDINALTPIEALMKLHQIQQIIHQEG